MAELLPVVSDLSAYVISGAVSAEQRDVEYESDCRTPAQGIQDVVEAERIGSGRCGCPSAGTSRPPT